MGPREVFQKLRAFPALPEDQDSIPSLYVAAHNYLLLQSQEIQPPLLASAGIICTRYISIHVDTAPINQK